MSAAGSVATLAASIAAADSASSGGPATTPAMGPDAGDDPMRDRRRTARLAGTLYFALVVLGPFVYFHVPGELFRDDPGSTMAAIGSNTGLFTAGLIAESFIVGVEVTLAGLLWKLFRPVSESLAFSSSLARVGVAFIQTVNVLLAGTVLIVVDRGGLSGFGDGDRAEIVGLLVDVIGLGVMVWGLLFGLHLVMLGVLVRRSELLPPWIGPLLVIAGVGYLAQSYGHLVDNGMDEVLANLVVVLSVPGELAFAAYLLIRGVRAHDRRTVPLA